MQELILVVIFLVVIISVGLIFYHDSKIANKGTETTAVVIESRQVSSNSGGSINGDFLISFLNENNTMEELRFRETLPQLYASQVQSGMNIKIKYLRSKKSVKVSLVFKK